MEGALFGQGAGHGLGELDVDGLCSYVWWFLTKDADDKERRRIETRLWRPPLKSTKPIPKESPWSAANEMKAFSALKAETGL